MHFDRNGQRLSLAVYEEFVLVADLAEQIADGGESEVGRGFVINSGDNVALLDAGIGGGGSGLDLDDFESFQIGAFGDQKVRSCPRQRSD